MSTGGFWFSAYWLKKMDPTHPVGTDGRRIPGNLKPQVDRTEWTTLTVSTRLCPPYARCRTKPPRLHRTRAPPLAPALSFTFSHAHYLLHPTTPRPSPAHTPSCPACSFLLTPKPAPLSESLSPSHPQAACSPSPFFARPSPPTPPLARLGVNFLFPCFCCSPVIKPGREVFFIDHTRDKVSRRIDGQ